MTRPRLVKLASAAGALVVVGVVVGISTSAAAPSRSAGHRPARGPWRPYAFGATGATGTTGMQGPFGGFHGPRGPGVFGGPIHSVNVVPNPSGGFETITTDGGTLKTVSGDSLTITEGTKAATYATPTISVPSTVKVTLDGKPSTLAALAAGDQVRISQSSTGTASVFATDASLKPAVGGGPGPGGGPGMGGPGMGGGPGVGRPGMHRGIGRWPHGGPPRAGATGATGVTAP